MSYTSVDVKNQIDKTNVSDEVKNIAKKYFNKNAVTAETVEDLLNPVSIAYTEELVDEETGEMPDPTLVGEALDILNNAVIKA